MNPAPHRFQVGVQSIQNGLHYLREPAATSTYASCFSSLSLLTQAFSVTTLETLPIQPFFLTRMLISLKLTIVRLSLILLVWASERRLGGPCSGTLQDPQAYKQYDLGNRIGVFERLDLSTRSGNSNGLWQDIKVAGNVRFDTIYDGNHKRYVRYHLDLINYSTTFKTIRVAWFFDDGPGAAEPDFVFDVSAEPHSINDNCFSSDNVEFINFQYTKVYLQAF